MVVANPVTAKPQTTPRPPTLNTSNTHVPIEDQPIYDIECEKVDLGLIVLLHDCRIVLKSGEEKKGSTRMNDIGNIHVTAPLTFQDNASAQSNPFANVSNWNPASKAEVKS